MDSAWTLHLLRNTEDLEVVGLLTTVNAVVARVAMHAVREELLERQAEATRLPLHKVHIPSPCSNEEYEKAIGNAIGHAKDNGIDCIAFGDLFLEDIRLYREEQLRPTGVEPIFPIWGLDTTSLARDMVRAGVKAHVICVDPKQLQKDFVGRTFDETYLDELPKNVDACGKRGEFHTFAYGGPMVDDPIAIAPGKTVERDRFVFADIKPGV